MYSAILSRSTVFEFKPVPPEEVERGVQRAFAFMENELCEKFEIEEGVCKAIAVGCGGDVRKSLNSVELCVMSCVPENGVRTIPLERAKELSQRSAFRYDKDGEEHYDILSAFQKSLRGSDPDAAIHYLARLIEANDLPSICRRLMVCYICGAAMGGYGALRCALTFPEQYAGCIALSPVADIEDFVNKEISAGKTDCWRAILGDRMLVPRDMELANLINESHTYSQIHPLIYIACGKRDDLYPNVVRLRDMLDRAKMDFIFEQADAGHEWGFWDIAVQRGLDAVIPDGKR